MFLACAIAGMWYVLAQKRADIARLASEKDGFEKLLAANAQDRADLDAYKEWEQTTIPWLDELYDFTARFPYEEGFRVNQFSAQTNGVKKGAKDPYVGTVNLSLYQPVNSKYVFALQQSMAHDEHLRAAVGGRRDLTGPTAPSEFKFKIDVAKQNAEKYETRLFVPRAQFAAPPPPVAMQQDAEEIDQ